MLPERTLDRLAIKKAQTIYLAISLTHCVNVEMMIVGKQNYYFAISQPGPQSPLTSPYLFLSAF